MEEERVNPEKLLSAFDKENSGIGRLRIFFGYAAGVGKTYMMLKEAQEQLETGKDVQIGYIEPHDRPATLRLMEGLPVIPTVKSIYKGISLEELAVDQILDVHPDIVLVDELAHTNSPSSRNRKRYQDVEELLNAGIDVYTTMNVQHLESLNDIVEEITGITVQEKVPDKLLKNASWKVIDIEPAELIDRLAAGKIYSDTNSKRALQNFFTEEKLSFLRGLAIQRTSDHINQWSYSKNRKVKIQTKLLTIVDEEYPKMSERCIRWTSRLVQGLNAEWIVLRLKSDSEELDTSSDSILELAEKLGAETVSLESENFIDTVVEYVKLLSITDIVMGKNLQKTWINKLFIEDTEDVLLKRLPFVEIHLIPYKEKRKQTPIKSLQEYFQSRTKDFIVSISAVVGATIVTELMQYLHFGDQNLMLIYILFVVITARATTGYLWSSLTAVFSVLTFNWFFVEPLYSLTVYKQGYPLTLVIMLIVSLLISNLVGQIRRKARVSMEKEQQFEILYELNKRYVAASEVEDLYRSTASYLSALLNREVLVYDATGKLNSFRSPEKKKRLLGTKEEHAVAFWTGRNQKEAGFGTDTLTGAKGFYLPVVFEKRTKAVLGLERSAQKTIDNNQLNYLRLIAAQLATAIEQMELQEEKQKILVDTEKERVRGNLLRAVSHDIRTPLTGISGLIETIINDEATSEITAATRIKLLKDVQDESKWLIQMVENLLSITRISSDTTALNKTEEPIEEIVSSTIRRVRKVYPKVNLKTKLPEELIFLSVDPILIEQALFNLIDNAVRHGKATEPIYISVENQDDQVIFSVKDHGIGMSKEQFDRILTNLTTEKEKPIDSKNGLGIGLTIVKTIIKAHQGTFHVENNEQVTKFIFTIPKQRRSPNESEYSGD
ncbi:sensor histidine kinase [Candidatus Enterococcus clewellii]|uniref:histidine kinase n=1 Tax=Candidatus Enterococcus clewellii TaxID=1834193 RepID=A0A242K1T2_9ENTE|nr:sensor histidine kinase KdpD [Enterococcus sp. 9E7_DIV0242]OTP11619.1 hypothetical protein A5888_003718 [Enterococcus sp. 9E7_DIV0242]